MLRRASALVVLASIVAACASAGPAEVTLAELALEADDYDGDVVEVVGVVREFTQAEHDAVRDHAVVEDDDQNRVALLPYAEAVPFADRSVRVVGSFAFDETEGRRIDIEEIEPVDVPADFAASGRVG